MSIGLILLYVGVWIALMVLMNDARTARQAVERIEKELEAVREDNKNLSVKLYEVEIQLELAKESVVSEICATLRSIESELDRARLEARSRHE